MGDPSLLEKQQTFVILVSRLIAFAYTQGFALTFGEAWRTPEQAAWNAAHGHGIAHSLHIDRLAVDFNLFKDGQLLSDKSDWQFLGDHWKSLSTPGFICTWGGDFVHLVDSGHFSIENNGYQ